MRMVKSLSELGSSNQTFCKLSGELFHLTQRNYLRHLRSKHLEKLQKHRLFFG